MGVPLLRNFPYEFLNLFRISAKSVDMGNGFKTIKKEKRRKYEKIKEIMCVVNRYGDY